MNSSPLYTSPIYAAMGSCEHALLGFAEGFGLRFLQSIDWAVHGKDNKIRSFAQSILNCPDPQPGTGFSFSIEEEKRTIKTLEQEGILNLKPGWTQTAATIAEIVLNILFVVVTAPISLTAALIAITLRAAVQNHRNKIAYVPQQEPKIWDGKSSLKIMTLKDYILVVVMDTKLFGKVLKRLIL